MPFSQMWVPLCIWASKAIKECFVLFFLGNCTQTTSNFLVPWENCSVEYKTFIMLQRYRARINIAYKLKKKKNPNKNQLNRRLVHLFGKIVSHNDLIFAFHPLRARLKLFLDRDIFKVLTIKTLQSFRIQNSACWSEKLSMVKTDTLKWKSRLVQEIRHACSFVNCASSELCTIIKSSGITQSYPYAVFQNSFLISAEGTDSYSTWNF